MESLCYSANKGSDDAYDVSTSLTEEVATVDLEPMPASLWWTSTTLLTNRLLQIPFEDEFRYWDV